eukprot:CAMPEP_0173287152 /NCGR_PEP_ID=MMETSP1143-20121109/9607_1 /TAXON_ID=483371 /ORGANISM="non described non described, Strain CCMP2298" /LENGTH=158 /DNA_ID=CAMNT_0014225583 /DNA_START=157 /DNA_END=633 /DNA_ORIENTATION=+
MIFVMLSALSGLANTASAPHLMKKSLSGSSTLPETPKMKQEQPRSLSSLVAPGPLSTGISKSIRMALGGVPCAHIAAYLSSASCPSTASSHRNPFSLNIRISSLRLDKASSTTSTCLHRPGEAETEAEAERETEAEPKSDPEREGTAPSAPPRWPSSK